MEQQYFATLEENKIGDEIIAKKDEYYKYLETSGQFTLLRNIFETYYRPGLDYGEVRVSGDQGQFLNICVNHFRNIIQHQISFITSQRPHFEPKAINTDTKSMLQAQLASNVLEYYNRIKKMERYTRIAVENAVMYGESFVCSTWNPTKGEFIAENEEGDNVFEGDIEFSNFLGIDVARDTTLKENDTHQWYIVRKFVNKYDLMAKYEELADRIANVKSDEDPSHRIHLRRYYGSQALDSTDNIPVYTFFHAPSEALPEGRMVELVASDVILHDGPLPYPELPVYRIAAGEQTDSIFGYSSSFDLLPLQFSLDKLHSTIVTNQAAFGVQNIALPKGNDLNSVELSGGLRIIEYDEKAGKPEALSLVATAPEIFAYAQQLVNEMETIGGVNSVTRGNPESSLKSGSALALVAQQAVQFAQTLQQSYVQLLEDLGTSVVNLLKEYATVPRIALISGKSNRSKLEAFKGDDLNLISRVIVDLGNALSRTVAGRVQMAEMFVDRGLVQNPQQILEVVTTGRLEPIYESEMAQLNLIRQENEDLSDGKGAVAIRTDNHQLHIQEHLSVLSTPEARQDPARVEAVLAHVAEHEIMFAQIQATGLIGVPEQAPINTGENGISQQEQGQVSELVDATNPVTQEAQDVRLPNVPEPPGLDGSDFDPTGGQ